MQYKDLSKIRQRSLWSIWWIKSLGSRNSSEKVVTEILVEIKVVQQQTNSVDGGLFAIAFATSLAFGEDPANVTYDSTKHRMQLIKCLDENQMTCFPKNTEKRVWKCQSRLAAVELYCKCGMSCNKSSTKYQDRMVECTQCLEWYHVLRENMPAKLFDSKCKSEIWHIYIYIYIHPIRI